MEFDLQEYLTDMRREQQAAHRALADKLDTISSQTAERLAHHDTRLVVLENAHKLGKWLAGTTVVTALSAAVSWFWGGK